MVETLLLSPLLIFRKANWAIKWIKGSFLHKTFRSALPLGLLIGGILLGKKIYDSLKEDEDNPLSESNVINKKKGKAINQTILVINPLISEEGVAFYEGDELKVVSVEDQDVLIKRAGDPSTYRVSKSFLEKISTLEALD